MDSQEQVADHGDYCWQLVTKRKVARHPVPEWDGLECALKLLDFKVREKHQPKTYIRFWRLRSTEPYTCITVRVRYWPDGSKPVNYQVHHVGGVNEHWSKQLVNSIDAGTTLATIIELLHTGETICSEQC
jgi:hypothetical protein